MPVEEQLVEDTHIPIYGGYRERLGQKLTISNRKVTKLAFKLKLVGSASGDLTYEIRRVSNDSEINSKVWGDVADLPTELTWLEVEFDSPVVIDEEVRICLHFTGGSDLNAPYIRTTESDVKADECRTHQFPTTWTNTLAKDCTYKYTWEEPPAPAAGGGPANLVAAGII